MTLREFARIYAALQQELPNPVFDTCVTVIIREATREETLPLEKAQDDRYQKLLATNKRLVRENTALREQYERLRQGYNEVSATLPSRFVPKTTEDM